MSQLQDRIAQFRKMANDDPENDLAHYRIGQLLLEDKQYTEAIQSFRRTLEIQPQFSKAYHFLALSLVNADRRDEAVQTLQQGYAVADQRGDNMPRDEMARMLVELGEPAPVSKRAAAPTSGPAEGTGFRCQRPTCMMGSRAHQLPAPPMKDETGKRIFDTICADCWTDWLKNYSIKVINELRLDLSTDRGQEEYDRYMREFLGLDEQPATTTLPQV